MALPELKGKGLLGGAAGPVGASALPDPASAAGTEDEGGASDSESAHSSAMLEAIKADDPAAYGSALKAFIQSCMREGERGGY